MPLDIIDVDCIGPLVATAITVDEGLEVNNLRCADFADLSGSQFNWQGARNREGGPLRIRHSEFAHGANMDKVRKGGKPPKPPRGGAL